MLELQPGRSYLFPGQVSELEPILADFPLFDRLVVDATELDVRSLRAVIGQLQLAAAERRLFLVRQADSLSDVMQNTLLKLLEEPPSTLVVVLQTGQGQRLLPTVQSRLHRLPSTANDELASATIFGEPVRNIFDQLAKQSRDELVTTLANEIRCQRSQLRSSPSKRLAQRIEWLDLGIKKLQANANQKLTLDWLLLRWGSD